MPGFTPNSQTGDYTDVVVRSPYGEIARAQKPRADCQRPALGFITGLCPDALARGESGA
jgi:hypothetical protein